LLQLEGGVASITGNGLSSDQAAMITSQGSAGAKYQQSVSVLGVDWVAMNIKGVLKDVRVRRALNYATDRRALAKTAFGTMTPWSLAFPKNLANYTRTATGYPYNPRKARSILKAAGYGRIALEFLHNGNAPWPNTAQILQQQWKRIGVDITITALGAAAFNEATSNQQGDLYGTDWFMVQPSALDEVSSCWVTDASSNYTGYSNKTVDKLAAAARTAPTIEASNALLAKVEQELGDDAAAIFTGSINFLVGRNPALQNFQYRGENGTYYDRLWIRKEH
jgi:peptide/nickel transport system substrate-binding protein